MRIRDALNLEPDAYHIVLNGVVRGRGEVKVGRELAINPGKVYGDELLTQLSCGPLPPEPAAPAPLLPPPELRKRQLQLVTGELPVPSADEVAEFFTEGRIYRQLHEFRNRYAED